MQTTAPSGNISTQYFGNKFDVNKVNGNIFIEIKVFVLQTIPTILMFDIKKKTMKEVSDNDQMRFDYSDYIDADLTHWSKNITDPSRSRSSYKIRLDRKISADEINNVDLDMMPGFTLTWNYNNYVELWSRYSYEIPTVYSQESEGHLLNKKVKCVVTTKTLLIIKIYV